MKRSHEAPALIARGELKPEDLGAFRAAMRALPDGRYALRVEPWKNRRSARANAYLWGHVYEEISRHTGHDPEEIHDFMCERFLPNERKRIEFFSRMTGETLVADVDRRRSSKLSGTPFYDFVEKIRHFAREFLSVETQDPDPEYWRGGTRRRAA